VESLRIRTRDKDDQDASASRAGKTLHVTERSFRKSANRCSGSQTCGGFKRPNCQNYQNELLHVVHWTRLDFMTSTLSIFVPWYCSEKRSKTFKHTIFGYLMLAKWLISSRRHQRAFWVTQLTDSFLTCKFPSYEMNKRSRSELPVQLKGGTDPARHEETSGILPLINITRTKMTFVSCSRRFKSLSILSILVSTGSMVADRLSKDFAHAILVRPDRKKAEENHKEDYIKDRKMSEIESEIFYTHRPFTWRATWWNRKNSGKSK